MTMELGQLASLVTDVLSDARHTVPAQARHGKGFRRKEGINLLTFGPSLLAAAYRDVTVTFVILTGSTGRSPAPVRPAAMASTTSIPLVTWPKIV
jgi:hypothetical protein